MRYEVVLARDPDSPAEARRALGEVSDHLPPRRLEDAQLLVSPDWQRQVGQSIAAAINENFAKGARRP